MAREIILPDLEPWQREVFDAMEGSRNSGKRFIVKARRQCGKSILAIVMVIKFSLEKKGVSVIVEPTQAQGRRVYKQIIDCLDGSGVIESANSTLLTINFVNGSEILFKSCEQDVDALRGFTVTNILVIDEGAFVPTDTYNILYPTTDAHNAPILVISTPLFMNGEYYDLYMEGLSGKSEMVQSFDWSAYDTSKYLSNDKLEYYRRTVAPLKFKSEYLGQFIAEGSYTFGDIMKAVDDEKKRGVPLYGGIDWGTGADEGDFTVLTLMDNDMNVTEIQPFRNLDSVEQIDRLARILNTYPTLKRVQVEMNSIGRVFYEHLKKKTRVPLKEFTTTNDTKRRVIEQLIEAFNTGDITIYYDEELIRELQHYAVEKTAKGYTYNGADGVNDDYVISLALCYDTAKKKNNNNFQIRFV